MMPALTALSASGPLASRAFMPLFIVSALSCDMVREYLPDFVLKKLWSLPEQLDWVGNPYFALAVGVLALGESLADKNDELKELMEHAQVFIKTAVAILVALTILPPETKTLVPDADAAGLARNIGIATATGTLTYFLARFRARFFTAWLEFEDDDDFYIRKIISLFEDLWTVVAIPFIILLPGLSIALVIFLLALAAGSRWLLYHIEQRKREPCDRCATEILPSATVCHRCKTSCVPREVLTWNVVLNRSHNNNEALDSISKRTHMLRLLSKRRCPACAEPVKLSNFAENGCEHCSFSCDDSSFSDWYDDYRNAVIARAMRMMLPLMLISWIPVVGISVAIVAIKLFLSGPLRVFLGRIPRFGLKWTMRLFTVLLLVVGSLPFVSVVAVPILIVVHILVYGHFAKRTVSRRYSSSAAGAL